MKTTVTQQQFINDFMNIRPNNFTYNGLVALFEYFEEYEEACDTEIEHDVIAVCCEYTEYESMEELQGNYTDIDSMEELEEWTTVIMINDKSFIILDF